VPSERCSIEEHSIDCVNGRVVSSDVVLQHNLLYHHATRHNTPIRGDLVGYTIATHPAIRHNPPIHNSLSTPPPGSSSQRALGTLPEDGNVRPKHAGATIHN
jgi:hypothetical protein